MDYDQVRIDLVCAALTGILANPVRWQQIKDQYDAGQITYDQASIKNINKAFNIADLALDKLLKETK